MSGHGNPAGRKSTARFYAWHYKGGIVARFKNILDPEAAATKSF
jgi:hypothetical protein